MTSRQSPKYSSVIYHRERQNNAIKIIIYIIYKDGIDQEPNSSTTTRDTEGEGHGSGLEVRGHSPLPSPNA